MTKDWHEALFENSFKNNIFTSYCAIVMPSAFINHIVFLSSSFNFADSGLCVMNAAAT